MTLTDDLRKSLSNPTPLYFAAGTADLAFQQAKKVPVLVEQLRAEAPARIEAVRRTDPKDVQVKAVARAKDIQESVQTAVTGVLGSLDTDLKKLGESAQGLALRGVGVAFEYAVRARETYEKVAEHGEQAVKTWRGENDAPSPAVETAPEPRTVVVKDTSDVTDATDAGGASNTVKTAPKASATPAPSATARKAAAKKTTARRNGTKKTTPPAK